MSGFDLARITQELAPPVQRGKLLALVSNGQLTPAIRGMIFLAINSMPQAELDDLAGKAIQALTLVKNDDMQGLNAFLNSVSIPAAIHGLIMTYAANINKE